MNIEDKNIKNSVNSDEIKNQIQSFCIIANKNLKNGNLNEAYKYFELAKNIYGMAYCLFLQGQISKSVMLLETIKDLNPFVNWLLCLTNLILSEKKYIPTYFQIRNFFEFDLSMLFLYKRLDYIKIIFKQLDYLAHYNQEIYKYAARVLMDNEINYEAEKFLKKSINVYYRDPEVHFMLAELYTKFGNNDKAKEEYLKSFETGDRYYPAIKKLKEIGIKF